MLSISVFSPSNISSGTHKVYLQKYAQFDMSLFPKGLTYTNETLSMK